MAPSFKNQIIELRDALTLSNCELVVAKKDAGEALTALSTVYRAMRLTWHQLRKIDSLKEEFEFQGSFLDDGTLRGRNVGVMTDHILTALEQIATAAAKAGFSLEEIKTEVEASAEGVQVHKDGLQQGYEVSLSSPLLRLNRICEWIDEEDQQIKAQIRASHEARLQGYRLSLESQGIACEDPEDNQEQSLLDGVDNPLMGQRVLHLEYQQQPSGGLSGVQVVVKKDETIELLKKESEDDNVPGASTEDTPSKDRPATKVSGSLIKGKGKQGWTKNRK